MNWLSEESYLLLNPRLSDQEKNELEGLFSRYSLPAHIWLTSSGSSRGPNESLKLVALSKKAILTAAKTVNQFLAASGQDHWLCVLPQFHIGGLSIFARAFLSDSKVTDLSEEKWSPDLFLSVIQSKKITLTSLVPTQVYDLVQKKMTCPSSLRAVLIGGGELSPVLREKAKKLGWPLLPSFGMTETSALIACVENIESEKLKVLPHCQVQLNTNGQLMIKGESLLTGYAQVKNGESIWVNPVQEGWFTSEDSAEIEVLSDQTFLRPLGRVQDYIKIKGEGVHLQGLRSTLEGAVIAEASDLFLKVYLRAQRSERDGHHLELLYEEEIPESTIQTLIQRYNHMVMPFERITQVTRVSKIPRTDLGKVSLSK